ncbi:MAG: DegT/DnrJ/EryC1/StrS family aminotransferase [Vulcanimicrobiota bacterium]
MIAQAKPLLGPDEEEAALKVMQAGTLAVGPELERFETRVGEFLGLAPVVCTASGFSALHLSLLALGLKPGAEVILPCISSCAAIRDAIAAARAVPVFADVASSSPNLDAASVERCLSPRTGAILCPHHLGCVAPLDELLQFGLPVLEDCAQALGASFQGKPVGRLGRVSAFSFYPTKLMAAIDGGAVASADPSILEAARDLRYYGGHNDERHRLNYKMANLNAAVGLVQLGRLPELLERRRTIGARYCLALSAKGIPLRGTLQGEVVFRFGLRTRAQATEHLFNRLRELEVPCRREWYFLCSPVGFARAQSWHDDFLTLPSYPALTDQQVDWIAERLSEAIRPGDLIE